MSKHKRQIYQREKIVRLSTDVGQRIEGIPPHGGCGQAGARVVAFNTLGAHLETGSGRFHLEIWCENVETATLFISIP